MWIDDKKVKLPSKTSWSVKDQAKADFCTCFIGRGSALSSTEAYRIACGKHSNKGRYCSSDVVFVSAEGARSGRLSVNLIELEKAVLAHAWIVTDSPANRERAYNVGEREVAEFLEKHGCFEDTRNSKFSVWRS